VAGSGADQGMKVPIDIKLRKRDVHSLLYEVEENGFVAISMAKLMRILGRGNTSPRMWRELLDNWEEIGRDRDELSVFVTHWQGQVVLSKGQSQPVVERAKE